MQRRTGRFLQTPTWKSGGLKLFIKNTAIVACNYINNGDQFLNEAGLFLYKQLLLGLI